MTSALTVVLAHDAVYASILKQWKYIWVLSQVSKEFAETIRPLRMEILRKMCANDPGPLLWPSKAKALFGCGLELMRNAALRPGLSFEAINAGFRQHQRHYTNKQTDLQLHADYQRLCEENKRQKQINDEAYNHRNTQALAEMDRERKAEEALLQRERAAIKSEFLSKAIGESEMRLRSLQATERFTLRMHGHHQRLHAAREANFAQWAELHQQALDANAKLFKTLTEFRDDRVAALTAKAIALAHGAVYTEMYDLH
jgi:hypothetical protein